MMKKVLTALFAGLMICISCRNKNQNVEGPSNTTEGVEDARTEGMEKDREWEQKGVRESQDTLERGEDTTNMGSDTIQKKKDATSVQ